LSVSTFGTNSQGCWPILAQKQRADKWREMECANLEAEGHAGDRTVQRLTPRRNSTGKTRLPPEPRRIDKVGFPRKVIAKDVDVFRAARALPDCPIRSAKGVLLGRKCRHSDADVPFV